MLKRSILLIFLLSLTIYGKNRCLKGEGEIVIKRVLLLQNLNILSGNFLENIGVDFDDAWIEFDCISGVDIKNLKILYREVSKQIVEKLRMEGVYIDGYDPLWVAIRTALPISNSYYKPIGKNDIDKLVSVIVARRGNFFWSYDELNKSLKIIEKYMDKKELIKILRYKNELFKD